MTALNRVQVHKAVFLMLVVLVQGDTQVGCVFGGSCVLPCRFQPNSDTILHWNKIFKTDRKKLEVHSYYDDQDQLGYQDPLYKGRTSLFHDQISGGNASLRLARVNLQDQGRYLCYASTSLNSQEAFVTLTVRAPMQSAPGSEVLLPCDASGLDDITWTFNHHQTILRRQAGQEVVVETEWQQHVRDLSESGSLLLYVTSSAQSEGTYRCTLRYADGEDVTHIELKILEDPVEEGSSSTVGIILGVMDPVIILIIAINSLYII
uniref:Ig-like domain-containing protein n=1 Tax=Gadus morhua TaxID=8049 RepID=A0A8C5AI43_GADMO